MEMKNLIVCATTLTFSIFYSTVCANPISEEFILIPNADTPAGYFGSSIAIDGDVMVVGAVRDYERGIDSGSAYIYERDENGEWIQQIKILPEDTESNDFLGVSVAVSDDLVAVGAVGDAFDQNPELFSFTGAVYIYKKTETTWEYETKIVAPEEHDAFGMSIALSGDSLFVGAIGSRKQAQSWPTYRPVYQGKVCVYKRDIKSKPIWTLSQEPMFLYGSKAYFGNAMTMNNDTLMVGAVAHSDSGNSGGGCPVGETEDCNGNCFPEYWQTDGLCDDGAYAWNGMQIHLDCEQFDCDGGDCTDCDSGGDPTGACCNDITCSIATQAECNTSGGVYHGDYVSCNTYPCGGAPEGACCTPWDGWCEVTTQSDCVNLYYGYYQGDGSECDGGPCEWQSPWREHVGATSILHHDGTDWTSSQSITPVEATSEDNFGVSIAIQDNLAVIGALGDSNAGEFSGAAYVYRNIGGVWEEEAKLVPTDSEYWGAFGLSVAISDNYIIVGSPGKSNSSFTGAVYLFLKKGKDWIQESKLMASDAMPDAWFGIATEVIDNYLVIGAPGQDYGAGALYFYNLDMIADSDNDGVPDAIDNCVDTPNPNQDDCNNDGVGDECDPLAIDCDSNGVPDECEVSSCWVDGDCTVGVCDDDLNCNGIPDSCDCLSDISGPTQGEPDGTTNVSDLLWLIALFGNTDGIGDVNLDGMVNVGDLLYIVSNWGPCE
jgi:hypothetical protein